jgi:hypothetical protein
MDVVYPAKRLCTVPVQYAAIKLAFPLLLLDELRSQIGLAIQGLTQYWLSGDPRLTLPLILSGDGLKYIYNAKHSRSGKYISPP